MRPRERGPSEAGALRTHGAAGQGCELPASRSVLAVCAHPDDESFGLGAVLHRFSRSGADVSLLCFTRGEASTLGLSSGALAELRTAELTAGAEALGIGRVELLDHPDGALSQVPLEELTAEVAAVAGEVGADLVVAFDEGGITGHPDHCRATEAALRAVPELPVLAWCLPRRVAEVLGSELGAPFVGRSEEEIDLVVRVDRAAQQQAIRCHGSQSSDNPVLLRRLELLGDSESLRWLRRPSARIATRTPAAPARRRRRALPPVPGAGPPPGPEPEPGPARLLSARSSPSAVPAPANAAGTRPHGG